MSLSRRDLLRLSGLTLGAGALPPIVQKPKAIPKRSLGKTGWSATIYAVGTAEVPGAEETVLALDQLLDAGVNYIDTAPSYVGTKSEQAIGQVMKRRRKEVFLATKTLARDAEGAYREVRESLARMQTDRIDLLQVHAVNDAGTLDTILDKGGAVEGLERAKKEGLIRFIGITGHTRPEVILDALKRYPFASILVPVSALDKHLSDFAEEVLPYARKQGVAVVGMKSLKGMERATGGAFDPEPLLRYAWSLPIDCLTIGLRRGHEVGRNLDWARRFEKMSESEMRRLEGEVKPHADAGNLWWKKR
jgi:predicted aldo/keto reductase-like oxidoreductase